MLRFMGSQRVGHDWATELNWTEVIQGVCASVWASAHPCHSCVFSNLLILHRQRVKYGELYLTFISTGKFPVVILNFLSNFNSCKYYSLCFPGRVSGKEPACQCRRCKRCRFNPWVGKIPWRRKWQPTSVFLLENPMDRGAWQATVRGVTQSQTWLKWLSTQSVFRYWTVSVF